MAHSCPMPSPNSSSAVPLPEEMVVMGRIGAPFGVRGWIKVQPFTEELDGLLNFPIWRLGQNGRWGKRKLLEGAVHGKGLIARIAGCEDRTAAEQLCGLEVAIPREALPATKENEYYWSDLTGLDVVNLQHEMLGTVDEVLETGGNDVLVVLGEYKRLLPFVPAVIREVNLAQGRIFVDWGADW